MEEIIDQLKDSMIGAVRGRLDEFLEANPEAKDYVQERAKRVAGLGVQYLRAEEGERAGIERSLKIVRQSIENEVDGIALVVVTQESKALFKSVFGAVLDTLINSLPALLKLVKAV